MRSVTSQYPKWPDYHVNVIYLATGELFQGFQRQFYSNTGKVWVKCITSTYWHWLTWELRHIQQAPHSMVSFTYCNTCTSVCTTRPSGHCRCYNVGIIAAPYCTCTLHESRWRIWVNCDSCVKTFVGVYDMYYYVAKFVGTFDEILWDMVRFRGFNEIWWDSVRYGKI